MPTETELADILTHIDQVIDREQPAATKALIDALVARVKVISATQLVPVFRVHHPHTSADDTDDDSPPAATPSHRADQAEHPVRTTGGAVVQALSIAVAVWVMFTHHTGAYLWAGAIGIGWSLFVLWALDNERADEYFESPSSPM